MLLYTFRKPLGSLADVRLRTGARILVNDVTFRNCRQGFLWYIFTVTGSLSLLYSPDEKQRKLVREHFNSSVAAE